MSALTGRKLEHLDICANGSVESGNSTLLDEVHLLHEALPELAWGQVDPRWSSWGGACWPRWSSPA